MRIYWYWPHPHRQASRFALAVRRADDQLAVHALGSLLNETFKPIEEYEVVRDLVDPSRSGRVPGARSFHRASVTIRRSQARRRLLRRGFDVAHLHMLVFQTDWAEIRSLRRTTTILAGVHDVRPHRRSLPARLETVLLKTLYQRAGHILVHHEVLADELIADFSVDPALIHVLPLPMDGTDRRTPKPLDRRPVILLFGALRANKGVDVLLDAASVLREAVEAEVVIAGQASPRMEATIRARASMLDNVRVELGYVSAARKQELFSEASCAVLPYTAFHSQSGVLADAYSYRLPLVVSDVGAIGPTGAGDRTGRVVPPGDAEALADALVSLISAPEPGLIARIDAAVKLHDYSTVGPQLRQLYDTIVVNAQ
jgi:glycosyltransferase involved in cell wall biosynthesis